MNSSAVFRLIVLVVALKAGANTSVSLAAVNEPTNDSEREGDSYETSEPEEEDANWFVEWLTRTGAELRERFAERLAKRYLEAFERDWSRPEDAHKSHLVEVEGIPFLIPDGYFKSRVRSDHLVLPELSIHASLPDIGADGAAVEPPPGYGDYLSIGLHPPALYTDMGRQLTFVPSSAKPLHTEVQFENALSGKARRNQTGLDVDKAAADFMQSNRLTSEKLQEISYFYARVSPEQDPRRYFVVFNEGRLVLRMRCHKPNMEKYQTYPSCWANAHFPDYPYSLTLIFDAEYRDEVYEIARRVYAKFDEFNAAAIGQLDGGPRFQHHRDAATVP